MQIHFLGAADDTPLTKTITRTETGFDIEPYPFIRDFNSFSEYVDTMEEMYASLVQHAALQHCILKGQLSRPLVQESRAGHTDGTTPTQWLLLDLDFDEGWHSVPQFLTDLNPRWKDVSYIQQLSSSARLHSPGSIRSHIFLMLEEPVPPAVIKIWLKERNLIVPKLSDKLRLSANAMSLKWPLDITTCQNDKLIYIAPPVCNGFEDMVSDRIRFHQGKYDRVSVPSSDQSIAAIDHMTKTRINTLREADGLPRKKPKYTNHGALTLLTNPEECAITGVKRARGFVYLNLNGGDSWAYYFPEDKPEVVYNFKDEPAVRLEDIAPTFYHEEKRNSARASFGEIEAFVFRDPVTDTYFNALYRSGAYSMDLISQVKSKDRLKDFMNQYGYAMPNPIEDWRVEFNPTTTKIVDKQGRWINRFQPTEYIVNGPTLKRYPTPPDVSYKVISSICGNDPETTEHFLNWLACLVQYRVRLESAWIFHGVQGTGKGLLLSRILIPILGRHHVTEWTTKEFEDNFNAALETTSLLWLDEFRITDAKSDSVMARLKNLITEHTLPIRAMRTDTYIRPNWVNVIIATNSPDPVHLVANDRRFNVAPAQELQLRITPAEVNKMGKELPRMAGYLFHRKADLDMARVVLKNEARVSMIEASQTSVESFFGATRKGDLGFFINYLRLDPPSDQLMPYQRFTAVLERWAYALQQSEGLPVAVGKDELQDVFRYITGVVSTPAKFTRMCALHRLKPLDVPVDKFDGRPPQNTKGFLLPFFVVDEEGLADYVRTIGERRQVPITMRNHG